MDSGGPEQITVMSDCTKAHVCVCTGFRFSRPPALHLMFPSPLPVFFSSFFFLFLSFRSHSSFLSPFSAPELWPESQPVGGQQLGVFLFFCREQKSFVWKKKKEKKKRWDYLSQRCLSIIFMCWRLCSCWPGCLSNKQWRCQAVKPKRTYVKCDHLTNGEITAA